MRALSTLPLIIALAGWPAGAAAEGPPQPDVDQGHAAGSVPGTEPRSDACAPGHRTSATERRLDGHRFILPRHADAPFVTSHFAFSVEFSYLEIPGVEVPDAELDFDLQLAGLSQNLELGIRFHRLFGFYARGQGRLVTSLNSSTALQSGVRALGRWDVGLMSELYRNDAAGVSLGARIRLAGSAGQQVRPIILVLALRDAPEQTVDQLLAGNIGRYLLTGEHHLVFGAALSVAKSLGRHLGVILSLDARAGSSTWSFFDGVSTTEQSGPRESFNLGATLNVDVDPYVPLGIQLEYRLGYVDEEVVEGTAADRPTLAHYLGLGTFYTGHPDLMLGLMLSTTIQDLPTNPRRFLEGGLLTRFFL